jgi:hypothetical protein
MIQKWFSRLGLSMRSSRAIEEATRDWRHEASSAASVGAAAAAHFRNTVAVVRAVAGSALQEARVFVPTYWSIAIPLVLFVIVGVPWISSFDQTFFTYPNVQALGWVTLSNTLTTALPAAAFLAIVAADPRRPAPILALGVGLVAVALVMTVVVMPAAWRYYADVGLRRPGFFPSVPYYTLAPALIMRIAAGVLLADRIRVDPQRRWLLLGALGVVTVLFGSAIHRAMMSDFVYARHLSRESASVLVWLLMLPSLAMRTVRFVVVDFPLPILSVPLWYALVKRHERAARRKTSSSGYVAIGYRARPWRRNAGPAARDSQSPDNQ